MNWKPSRRQLLHASAGLAGGVGLFGRAGRMGTAFGQTTTRKSAVVIIFLNGGYNALFSSADSFLTYNHFGVTSSNVRSLGNGLVVDAGSLGSLPAAATSHMATIGTYHRYSGHDSAPRAEFSNGSRSYPLMLASAMGGTGAIKCAAVGTRFPAGPRPEENGVSMQMIADLSVVLAAMGASSTDSTVPNRVTGARALMASRGMAANPLASNPNSLKSVREGYDSSIAMLQAPPRNIDYASIAAAYGVSTSTTTVSSFATQMLAAELMIMLDCNVVLAVRTGDWDTHTTNPADGVRDRNAMANIFSPLNVFLTRMMGSSSAYDVTTVIMGDFARSLPSSDHANFLSATVMGPRVKVGTTGRAIVTRGSSFTSSDGGTLYNDKISIDPMTPGVPGFWSYLATVANAPTNPFGPNPHALVL